MLGKTIRELRVNRKLSQKELALALNVSFQAVSFWETDRTDPDIGNIIALSRFFCVSTDYLFGLENEAGCKIIPPEEFSYDDGVHRIKHKRG